jgi:hypothetical protein
VEYVELDEIDAAKLVEHYNKQAEADRLLLLVENRMKKNDEKSRNLNNLFRQNLQHAKKS